MIDLIDSDLLSKEAQIQEVSFINFGKVGSWLMSDVFELAQDQTTLEGEKAIVDALKLQIQKKPSKDAIKEVSERLFKYLSGRDTFIPRWVAFADKHGVEFD